MSVQLRIRQVRGTEQLGRLRLPHQLMPTLDLGPKVEDGP